RLAEVARVLKVDRDWLIHGIGDGAPDLEASIDLLKAMIELGYSKVITTPHSMADGFRNGSELILSKLEELRTEVTRQGLAIQVDAAAEYYLDHMLEERIAKRDVLTFGKDMLLFELPFISEPAVLLNVVFHMQTEGYTPVLAHPERYGFWHQDLSKYERLKDRGVLFQLNTVALCGAYGAGVKRAAEKLIDLGWYELMGSDCHNMGHIQALRASATEPYLHKLLESGKLINASL
ncbi:MAG: hypothetical protein KDB88_01400, partial [Flavobacteriales bacterium]|nr:hypothetical protein [Flavobacteriales bacterium]